MRILAIETSCDETAIAIADFTREKNGVSIRVLSHLISSQAKIHTKFGGVVPNLARREHEKNLVPMLMTALRGSGIMNEARPRRKRRGIGAGFDGYVSAPPTLKSATAFIPAASGRDFRRHSDKESGRKISIHNSNFLTPNSILEREAEILRQFKKYIVTLPPPDIDAIAVTYGPGLAPALWTGVNFARALAYLWDKPLIPVNHMAGHLYSAFLEKSGESLQATSYELSAVQFPILALLVSGAHTELVLMRKHNRFQIIGETRDDAVGEVFDKVARMLGLKYPGGPVIAKLALKGNPRAYDLPRPMLHTKDYDFSFSGLKTAVLYLVRDLGKLTPRRKQNIAASFQTASIEVLVKKTIRATKEYKVKTVLIGGGVAANTTLRKHLGEAVAKEISHSCFLIPDSRLTGDNALMIAVAAYFCNQKSAPHEVRADANLRLGENNELNQ